MSIRPTSALTHGASTSRHTLPVRVAKVPLRLLDTSSSQRLRIGSLQTACVSSDEGASGVPERCFRSRESASMAARDIPSAEGKISEFESWRAFGIKVPHSGPQSD